MDRIRQQIIKYIAAAALLAAAFFVGRQAAVTVSSGNLLTAETEKTHKFCVVIDAGHGGEDPGKVGVGGTPEKDLNLSVAKQLAILLEQADVKVVMTRNGDEGLYEPGTTGKKVQDMKRRVAIMDEANPDLVVSIHQNSYSDSRAHGAQVFYYSSSEEGKKLASLIQKRLVEGLDPENRRLEKENDSYYLLKKARSPIVIVECGFLSNREEEQLLCDPVYQQKAVWQIHMGILQYLNQRYDLTQ